ncbi:MAG: hypothetical protein ACR2H6_00685 [Pyrinomonadaceae bacterium]
MKPNNKTTWRFLLIALAVVPLLFWGISSEAQKGGGKASANLDQIRNGAAGSPIDPPNWVNGNAGKSNAHYREGESIGYRLVITGLKPNSDHFVEIEWDITHSSVNAIDYITHFDRSTPTVQPCLGVATCNAASFDTAPIPAPASNNSPVGTQPIPSFNALPAGQRLMTIYNGNIADDGTGLVYINPQGNLSLAQSKTGMRINFHADSATVVISWGGHIASRLDWGFDAGTSKPRSAGGISGSPYHTRLLSLDGSGGNQDRSLSADAVLPPAECILSGDENVCASTPVVYTGTAGNDSYSWTLTDNGTGSLFANGLTTFQSTTTNAVTVNVGATAGTYTLNLVVMKAGTSQNSCPFTGTVHVAPQVSVTLTNECDATVSLNAVIANPEAGVTYGYLWNTGATTSSITPTAPGNYSVTVTNPNNPTSCGAGTGNLTLCFTVPSP